MQILTTEQVLALAPDAASVKAGQGLSNPGKWVSLGRDDRAVWGDARAAARIPIAPKRTSPVQLFTAPARAGNFPASTVSDCSCCTPDLFPHLMANAIQRRDVNQWAATQGIKVERGEKPATKN